MAEVRYMSPAVKYIKKIKDKQLKKKFNLDYSWKYHKAHAIRLYAIF